MSAANIENAVVIRVECGTKSSEGRFFGFTFALRGDGWQQSFSLGIRSTEQLSELCELLGGELVRGIEGKPVRVRRKELNGPIVAVGDLIADNWLTLL